MKLIGNLKHIKRCTSCGEVKTYDEFYKQPSGRFGRNARCKCCKRKEQLEYDKAFRNKGKTKGNRNASEWLIKGNIVYQFLKNGKVIYCGQTYDFYGRMSQHRASSEFYDFADELRVCKFSSKLSMHIAEAILIAELQPCFNSHTQDGVCDFAKLPDLEWEKVKLFPKPQRERRKEKSEAQRSFLPYD